MNLPDVAKTAILTLICRVIDSAKDEPISKDPMAVFCFEELMAEISEEEKAWILDRRKMYEVKGAAEVNNNLKRQRTFDNIADQFVSRHPACTVVNLGCGFDTRFWRLADSNCIFVEVDLPEVIELKKKLLKEHLCYELIGCSVLDTAWIDKVTSKGKNNILLLAEGLFMYLPAKEAAGLLQTINQRFNHSQIVLDTIDERYTKGFLKWIVDLRIRAIWGLKVSFLYGIKKPGDLETYGKDFKITDVVKGAVGPIITLSINDA